jgi:hypothetical protein
MSAKAGLHSEVPLTGVLTRLEASTDQDTFQCFFENSDLTEVPTTDTTAVPWAAPGAVTSALLVTAEAPDITVLLATVLHAAGIVYDGRIVVDAGLRACGLKSVLAAGPAAKFSRAAGGIRHSAFPSDAIGAALGAAVLRTAAAATAAASPALSTASASQHPPPLVQLPMAGRPLACSMPGKGHFALVGTPGRLAAPAASAAPGGTVAATTSARGHCQIVLSAVNTIEQIAYAGNDGSVMPETLVPLIGAHCALVGPDFAAAVKSHKVCAVLVPCMLVSDKRHAFGLGDGRSHGLFE